MLPSAIQCLAHLPTSTTGKVDRTALPNPETTGEAAGDPPQGHVEERLARLWCHSLRVDGDVYRDSDFFELGGHSMLAVELSFLVEREFGYEMPLRQFLTMPTLRQMAAAIEAGSTTDAFEPGDPDRRALVHVQTGEVSLPLLLWVPSTGGSPLELRRFAAVLPKEIELMGFEAPPHRGRPGPATMSDLAAAYADDVRSLARAGTIGAHRGFVLGGNSFGATLAHEIASLLYDDCRPGAVILVDPLFVPLPAETHVDRPVQTHLKSRATDRVVTWTRRRRSQAKRALRRLRRLLSRKPLQPVGGRRPLPASIERAKAMSQRLRETYQPRPYPGSVVLFATEARQQLLGDKFIQARPLVLGKIVLHSLPGKHGQLLGDERVHQIAAVVEDAIRNLPR
jgi:thioesterase domain-containing protein/acyl carrier protein